MDKARADPGAEQGGQGPKEVRHVFREHPFHRTRPSRHRLGDHQPDVPGLGRGHRSAGRLSVLSGPDARQKKRGAPLPPRPSFHCRHGAVEQIRLSCESPAREVTDEGRIYAFVFEADGSRRDADPQGAVFGRALVEGRAGILVLAGDEESVFLMLLTANRILDA